MLTIIFGAGASYDSDPDKSSIVQQSDYDVIRPPLAKDLFAKRFGQQAMMHPDAATLIPQLRRAARKNPPEVEQELENISNDRSYYAGAYRQLLSMRYYLKDVVTAA